MLIHQQRSHPPPLNITFNDCCIEQVSIFKLLGVIIDEHLRWSPRMFTELCSRIILRRSRTSSASEALHIINWKPLPNQREEKIVKLCKQLIQPNSAETPSYLRLLAEPRTSSASEALHIINWKPLPNQREEKIVKLCKQLIQPNSAGTPSYLRLLAEPIASTHSYATRSATRGHLTTRAIRSKYRKKAFSYRMAKAWNATM